MEPFPSELPETEKSLSSVGENVVVRSTMAVRLGRDQSD